MLVLTAIAPLVLLGLSSFIVTPFLGFLAIKDINNSMGQLYGMRLAVFDVVFYPIMLFNVIYIASIFYLCSFVPIGRIVMLIAMLTVPVVDYLLYRMALKKAKE